MSDFIFIFVSSFFLIWNFSQSYLTNQNTSWANLHIKRQLFAVVCILTSSVCILARAAVFTSYEVSNTTPFWGNRKVKGSDMHAPCACAVGMHGYFAFFAGGACLRSTHWICVNSDIWWLTTPRRNSNQPVLVWICRECAIMEAWLSVHDVHIMYPHNTSYWS